jgi:hypothetical protein
LSISDEKKKDEPNIRYLFLAHIFATVCAIVVFPQPTTPVRSNIHSFEVLSAEAVRKFKMSSKRSIRVLP